MVQPESVQVAYTTPAAGSPGKRTASTLRAVDFVGVVIVAAFCALAVWVPYGGDTALFATAARTLNHGGVYYRDFWDIKQPGIYWFYQAADLLPGPLWVPARLLLGLWMVAFAVLVLFLARKAVRSPWVARLAPLFVVLPLMLGARPSDLGVPEPLLGLPMLGSFALVARSMRPASWRLAGLLGAGALGSVVVLLKLPHALVLVGVVAVLLWPQERLGRRATRTFVASMAWYLLGVALPLLALGVSYAWQGMLVQALRTNFTFPAAISRLGSLHEPVLYWYFLMAAFRALAPLLPLAVVGLVAGLRARRRDTVALVVWIVLTAVVIAPQKPNTYQGLAFVVPVGILAVLGADSMAQAWSLRTWPRAWSVALAGLTLMAAGLLWLVHVGGWAASAIAAGGVPTRSAVLKVAPELSSEFATMQAAARTAPEISPSTLYVFSNPLLYVIMGRGQAIEVNGWSPEFAVPSQWAETRRELVRTRPELIFVDAFTARYLVKQPGIEDLLRQDYVESASSEPGDHWYLRKPSVTGGPTPPTVEGCLIGPA